MRIVFLAAANSIHSFRWVKYFHDKGYEVAWISLAPCTFEIPERIDYFEIKGGDGHHNLIVAARKARAFIKRFSPDIVHVHYVGSYGILGLFSGVANIIATPWGSDVIEGKLSPVKKFFITKILKRAKLITCDAYHMRDEVIDLGVDREKIHIINFGIDSQRFQKRSRSDDIRKQFGLSDEPTVISLRNFEPVYDIKTLIQAVPDVVSAIANVKFILVGKGSLGDELKSLAEELGVDGVVNFVGYVQNEQLPDIMCSMDVYVSTSLSDAGIAASTAEAMACEVPVVVTDSGENDRWIEDGKNGFLVPVSAPKGLAARIVELLGDEKLCERFGREGRGKIMRDNDAMAEMDKMDTLYQRIGGQA